ncbi:MAG: 50S ribosomal protein L17 [Leptospiraceae bacterium]|nr:50S ribosomal protein L17 [Leptospiraceae bacterium]MCP5511888.1 50S ribosomal protein L17 [Leptospiraceae bacterium]
MNKRNKVKQLNRDSNHRKALINNMVTSLFEHERIESSLAKIKVIRSHAEKLITRAKKNLEGIEPEKALHNKREVMKKIHDREVVIKLFEDIAPRFQERNGGYTRIYKLVNRASDNTEMGILELTSLKSKEEIKEAKKERKEKFEKQKEERKKSRESSKKAS